MNTYRVTYHGPRLAKKHKIVEADTVNGFKNTCDSYVFKVGKKVVYVIPKTSVIDIEIVNDDGEQID